MSVNMRVYCLLIVAENSVAANSVAENSAPRMGNQPTTLTLQTDFLYSGKEHEILTSPS